MGALLEQIEELEDNINDKLQVILFTSQNGMRIINYPITYNESIALHVDFQTIEANCKELAKLTATAIGELHGREKLLKGGD